MSNKVANLNGLDNSSRGMKKVYAQNLYNVRPAYTNNEIVNLFHYELVKNNDTIEKLSKRYGVGSNIINYMVQGNVQYSYTMLKIAADYTKIPFDSLTEVLQDDNKFSCRANTDEGAEELFDIVNYLFNEMIKQERMAK